MASSSSRRRKGKEPMVAKPPTYDANKFRSQFHEARYHRLMKTKHIIHEMGFNLKEGEYPIMRQITKDRRWELLCVPFINISAVMIREFYANAMKESENSPPYKSFVRGVEVDFNPATVMRVMQLRKITYEELSFERKMQGQNDPDEILQGICLEGSDWERDSKGTSSHLKRMDLTPEANGWYKIVRRSIFSTGNTSTVIVKRALLVYCILHGGEIDLSQIIADNIQEMAENRSKSDEDTEKVKVGKGITKKSMKGINEEDDQEKVRAPRRNRSQRGEEQAPSALELSEMRRTIEEISQQLMQAQQEQYL
ncbi:uncharacterized protein DS421_9g269870 [Arachis hypogaea]|nr:uncharacterized protein DS421_9g269870 [Arachis hypogaea]